MKRFVEIIKNMLTKRIRDDIIVHEKSFVRCSDVCKEEFKKNMDVTFVANYLIQCFWKTRVNGKRIECTRTKIGKLLTIIQILSIKINKQVAFEDTIAEEICGTSVPVLSVYRYPYDIWELLPYKLPNDTVFYETNGSINLSEVSTVEEPLPSLYEIHGDVDGLIQKIIYDVFIGFGAYDSYEIGRFINEFKTTICIEKVVSKEKIADWLSNLDIQTINPTINPIISFIFNYNFK